MSQLRQGTHAWRRAAAVTVIAVGLVACGPAPPTPMSVGQAPPIEPLARFAERNRSNFPRLVTLGDSLTAGLGLAPNQAYPARLQDRLDAAGYQIQVVNAGVSGDTSAGGLRRLEWALDGDVELLVVALGGNDGLRGLPVDQMKDNLTRIITEAEARDVEILLAGMEAPPNFGYAYTDAFREVFHTLAHEHDVVFVPFLLEGVAGVPNLNQRDGIHPNAEGAARVADHLWPAVESLARRVVADVASSASPSGGP